MNPTIDTAARTGRGAAAAPWTLLAAIAAAALAASLALIVNIVEPFLYASFIGALHATKAGLGLIILNGAWIGILALAGIAFLLGLGYIAGKATGFASALGFHLLHRRGWKASAVLAALLSAVAVAVPALSLMGQAEAKPAAIAALLGGFLAVAGFFAVRMAAALVKKDEVRSILTIASMAIRNLTRHKKATFLIGGVIAFGVLIICLMQGCAGAMMGNVSSNVANLYAGHIYVDGVEKLASGKEFSIIRDDSQIIAAMQATGLKPLYVSRRASFNATLSFSGNSTMQSVSGVDFSKETYLTERLAVADGSLANVKDEKAIIVSERMAKALKAKPGYKILAQLTTFSGQESMGEFTIAAIVKDAGQLSQGSMSAYANLSYVNKLLNLPAGSYQQLSFYMGDMRSLDRDGNKYYAALKAAGVPVFERKKTGSQQEQIMERLRGDKTETWEGAKYKMTTLNERLSGLQDLVNGINIASLIALAVLFLVIMVGITNTFRMIMLDRIKEIGTMRALGMQSPQVLSLFLFEASFLALCGALAGLVIALLVMLGFSIYNFGDSSMLAMLLDNGHLTFNLNPLLVLANVGIIAGLTLLAALIPARMAAKLEPANALRTEK
jgi:putative ABC transport system permease protein